MSDGILVKYCCPDNIHSLVFDDNGRVSYAYLLEGDNIISDVWLYNRCVPPKNPEWKNGGDMPFANSQAYLKELEFAAPNSEAEVSVKWKMYNEKLTEAQVFIRGILHASLVPFEKPGRSKLAKIKGPLADTLEFDQ